MIGFLPGGIVVKAVWSPVHGVVLMGQYVGPRRAVLFHEPIAHDATPPQITHALRTVAEQIGDGDPAWKSKYLRD